jgi:phage portal protein BeeE
MKLPFWFEIKKSNKINWYNKDIINSMNSNWFSFIWNNIWDCWTLRINLNTLYSIKEKSSDVFTCHDILSNKTALNGLLLQDKKWNTLQKNKYIDEYNYLNELFSEWTFRFWKDNFFTQILFSWEVYIEPVFDIYEKVKTFTILDSRNMSKILDKNWVVITYRQRNKLWAINTDFWIEELYYSMYKRSVKSDNVAFSKIEPLIFDVLWDLEASKRNYYFFKNNAVPDSIVMVDPQSSDEQIASLTEQLKNKYTWWHNSHKFIASSSIKDIKELNISSRDMEFIQMRWLTTEKISSAFWIPKKILWYESKFWWNSEINSLKKEFYQWTIKWYESYLESIINWALNQFKKNLRIDLSQYIVISDSEHFDNREFEYDNQRKDLTLW